MRRLSGICVAKRALAILPKPIIQTVYSVESTKSTKLNFPVKIGHRRV